jgi:DNA polymerase V
MQHTDAIALLDCNNFYASVETVFQPKLRHVPVVVLSNNDGCVISRNQKAREIVPMGKPLFEVEDLLEDADAEIFSSNYELYGDMSRRVMENLKTFSPEIEVYSIDEAFFSLHETQKSFDYLGREIQDKIYKWTGLPVGIGIAETKTLAKIANKIAKKSDKAKGVLNLFKSPYQDVALERTPIGDVWGIGRQSVKKLEAINVKDALRFKYLDLRWVKKNMTVVGGRTLLELRGVRCLPLELEPPPKKSITCSRSFGEPVSEYKDVYNACAYFLSTAAAKLRRHRLAARSVTVLIETNRFSSDYYSNYYTYSSAYPSDNLFELMEWMKRGLERIFKERLVYRRAGIILGGLIPVEAVTGNLYADHEQRLKYERVMKAMDEINKKFGRDTIRLAVAGKGKWEMKRERISQRYTTRFNELLVVK